MRIYIDEAGRGPLAWPLYVGLILPLKKFSKSWFKDSKQINHKQRELLFQKIKKLESDWKLLYSIGISTHKEIDKRWLTKATNMAIKRWLKKLSFWPRNSTGEEYKLYPSLHLPTGQAGSGWQRQLIIDWNNDFWLSKDLKIAVKTIIHGDDLVKEISMASIIAKVSRDQHMEKLHRKYPQYGFDKHKWYGTRFHYAMIQEYWICEIHRKLFLKNIKIK